MDKKFDFPVYRSDANDPEEKNSPDVNHVSENRPAPPPPVSELVGRKETELKLQAERKLAEASEKRVDLQKGLEKELSGQISDPRHLLG